MTPMTFQLAPKRPPPSLISPLQSFKGLHSATAASANATNARTPPFTYSTPYPPILALCQMAKTLRAATGPITLWILAAIDPTSTTRTIDQHETLFLLEEIDNDHHSPARTPTKPNPNASSAGNDRISGAKRLIALAA
ncbi:MAG: hypothetical protein LQ337_001516 [Flavoplaca oasis]|nr:MAG: hypothetical protein LQ337_001516 [Flavoplaca oasis]